MKRISILIISILLILVSSINIFADDDMDLSITISKNNDGDYIVVIPEDDKYERLEPEMTVYTDFTDKGVEVSVNGKKLATDLVQFDKNSGYVTFTVVGSGTYLVKNVDEIIKEETEFDKNVHFKNVSCKISDAVILEFEVEIFDSIEENVSATYVVDDETKTIGNLKNKDIISIELAPYQMASTIELYLSTENEEATHVTTSVNEYCRMLKNNNSENESLVSLINSFLEYGKYASKYHRNDTTADRLDSVNENDLKTYTHYFNHKDKDLTINLTKASLSLGSKISIKVYYESYVESLADKYSVAVCGSNGTYVDNSRIVVTEDAIILKDIKASELLNKYHFMIVDKDTNKAAIDFVYSPMSYAKQAIRLISRDYTNLSNLMTKLYLFGCEASKIVENNK